MQLDLFPEPKKILVTLLDHCSELLHIDGKDWLLIMPYIFVESCVNEQHSILLKASVSLCLHINKFSKLYMMNGIY